MSTAEWAPHRPTIVPRAPDLSGLALDGRYELLALIGEGTFGRVYRGRDRRLARQVAVKVIKPWWAEDPQWARTFEREAQLLASVSDPGIIQIFDVGSAPEGLYYVAELVEGESLSSRLKRGPLVPADACEIALQLARALAGAHMKRVVHRDVKPANVLIAADGTVKVGDFGVARLAEGSSDGPLATVAGTPGYMAPEQAQGAATSPATDVYGVGVVLYEMLAGKPPFQGSTAVELALHHLQDPPPPLPPEVPPMLSEVARRALAKDPAERFRDGHELEAALALARSGLQASSGQRSPDEEATQLVDAGRDERPSQSPIGSTRVAPLRSRRNFHPAERRQRMWLLLGVVVLALGMGAAALALATGHLKVPNLRGLSRRHVAALGRRDGFQPAFSHRYSSRRAGTAIAQSPAANTRVQDGATVNVVLSAGPAPVKVPDLVGRPASQAQALLGNVKLRVSQTLVAAPGTSPGVVANQSPAAGRSVASGSTVALAVAEQPRLRALTTLQGDGGGRSVPFRIRGKRWQIRYSMGYDGTCTFIFFCSGPTATVTNSSDGSTVDQFDLNDGSGQNRVLKSGPGVYEISVSPGSDAAHWKILVADYY